MISGSYLGKATTKMAGAQALERDAQPAEHEAQGPSPQIDLPLSERGVFYLSGAHGERRARLSTFVRGES